MEKKIELHMKGGDSITSYSNNSSLQKFAISKTWSILDQTLKNMFTKQGPSNCLRIVDLGCASGPNTLRVISHIMETINKLCKNAKVDNLLGYEVYLNDLPNNDFNNLFKMLHSFEQDWKNCFIFGLPRSFYGRLFPSGSLHFAYSCYGLHWLSQVPDGVKESNENIHITRSSPEGVFLAYKKQYHIDFSRFLRCRGEEMIGSGHMVLAFIGRSDANCSSKDMFGGLFALLEEILSEMTNEGLINMDGLRSFNVPVYSPSREEVKAIIKQEGSFNLDRMDSFEVPWDANGYEGDDLHIFDTCESGKIAANCVRAFMEPMLTHHFGNAIDINDIFDRFTRKAAKYISQRKPSYFTIAISLSKRDE